MRSTVEILSDIEDGKKPDYEELYMCCLVQKSLMFFARENFKNLLKGGIMADFVKSKFPDSYAKLGISKDEYNALKMDPYDYLSPEHIPGTPEWERLHKIATRLLKKAMKEVDNEC